MSRAVLVVAAVALAARMQAAGLQDAAKAVPGLEVELKYATTDNFLHRDVYGGLHTCYLRPGAIAKLARAQQRLPKGYHLRAYDCARPRVVQQAMWQIVRGTPQQPYVADPAVGSIHALGWAIDLTVVDATGRPLDMGSPFDAFYEAKHLTQAQRAHRQLLRDVMVKAGFHPLANEWWHFDGLPPAEARQRERPLP